MDYKEWLPHHDKRNHSVITDEATGVYTYGGKYLRVNYVVNRPWCIENFISNHVFLVKRASRIFNDYYEYTGTIPYVWLFLKYVYNNDFPYNWGVETTDNFTPDTTRFKAITKLNFE